MFILKDKLCRSLLLMALSLLNNMAMRENMFNDTFNLIVNFIICILCIVNLYFIAVLKK